jgi:1,4-dihydroxy-2-naphthoate octaprenyltransferase
MMNKAVTMNSNNPSIAQMIRAPFLSSIIAPLITGSLLAAAITGSLGVPAFILVLITGLGLHIATNVYNDIYDTIQGTDKVNVHRNEYSGGSGVLLDRPELMKKMYALARSGLIIALITTAALLIFVNRSLWVYLGGLYLLSAFFSKFYTAAPIKLAYRGMGEFSVWFAFGPMAVAIAAVSQNIFPDWRIFLLMPVSGISTLTILLVGQLIDLDADIKGGKHGVASRMGTRFTAILYIAIQIILIVDVAVMALLFPGRSWLLLISLLPYILFFPKTAASIIKCHDDPDQLKAVAKSTVQIHLLFSILLIVGFGVYLI